MKFRQYKSPRLGRKVWRFDFTICGQRIRRGEFSTKREAQEAVAALQTKVRAIRFGLVEAPTTTTLKQLVNARSKDPFYAQQRGTVNVLNRFLEVVSGNIPVIKLSKADLKTYRLSLNGLKPNSINRYLAIVTGMLHAAGEYFPDLAEWQPPKISREKAGQNRERVLTPEEITKILTQLRADHQKRESHLAFKARQEAYDLFRLVLLTAAREGELINLQETALNTAWKLLNITATKTKTTRAIPVSDLAIEILCSRSIKKGRFFSIKYYDLWTAIKKASERAKIPWGNNIPGGWVTYDLRHTAATVMELAGVPYSTVSAILGHKRQDMTSTYTHTTIESMKNGIRILESWCRDIDGFLPETRELQGTPKKRESLAS